MITVLFLNSYVKDNLNVNCETKSTIKCPFDTSNKQEKGGATQRTSRQIPVYQTEQLSAKFTAVISLRFLSPKQNPDAVLPSVSWIWNCQKITMVGQLEMKNGGAWGAKILAPCKTESFQDWCEFFRRLQVSLFFFFSLSLCVYCFYFFLIL